MPTRRALGKQIHLSTFCSRDAFALDCGKATSQYRIKVPQEDWSGGSLRSGELEAFYSARLRGFAERSVGSTLNLDAGSVALVNHATECKDRFGFTFCFLIEAINGLETSDEAPIRLRSAGKAEKLVGNTCFGERPCWGCRATKPIGKIGDQVKGVCNKRIN